MAEPAAEIVDRVIRREPFRLFVLSVPHRFRYRLAHDHAQSVFVLGLFVRAVMAFYRRCVKTRGLRAGQTGRSRS
jgi:hypothetical protein